jgi:hypothetical protein
MAYRNGTFVPNETKKQQHAEIARRATPVKGIVYGRSTSTGRSAYEDFYKRPRLKLYGDSVQHRFKDLMDENGGPVRGKPNAYHSKRFRQARKAELPAKAVRRILGRNRFDRPWGGG